MLSETEKSLENKEPFGSNSNAKDGERTQNAKDGGDQRGYNPSPNTRCKAWRYCDHDTCLGCHPSADVVYFAWSAGLVKIGHSTDLKKRLRQLTAGSAAPVHLIGYEYGPMVQEKSLHKRFRMARDHDEWFWFTQGLRSYLLLERSVFLVIEKEQIVKTGHRRYALRDPNTARVDRGCAEADELNRRFG